jgi:hypothetical protein
LLFLPPRRDGSDGNQLPTTEETNMRYRNRANTESRNMYAKYAGKCTCCGADIKAGEYVTYYPSRRAIAHVGGLDGNSATCCANIRAEMYPDPGELAADRWNEQYR